MAEERLTHAALIVQYGQSAFHRHLDLDKLMPLIVERGILKEKRGEKIQKKKDFPLFLALLGKKKIEAFVDFLKCLEQTFDYSEGHRLLVSCMSSDLLAMEAPPEAREAIRAVVEAAAEKTQLRSYDPSRTGENTQLEIQQQGALTSLQPESSRATTRAIAREEKRQRELETLTRKLEETSLQPQQSGTHASTQAAAEKKEDSASVAPPKGYVEPRRSECFTGSSGVFYCPSHGVTIDIPEGAVTPDSHGRFVVSMHAYVSGPFEVPSETEPCTVILLLRVHPRQKFQKQVKLRVPHCAVVEDEDIEFFFLRAPEPADRTCPYRFAEELETECAEDGYHMETEVDHFSAFLGCRRRSSTRRQKPRRSSSKKSPVRRRLRSFERTTPGLARRTSSTASKSSSLESSSSLDVSQDRTQLEAHSRGRKRVPSLTRQDALDDQDTSEGGRQSSTDSSNSLNHLYMARWSHGHHGDGWTETFIVSCSLPSTSLALRQSTDSGELDEQSFVTTADVLEFRPDRWSECGWEVEATKTPSLHIPRLSPLGTSNPRLSYEVVCRREQCAGPLRCRVDVDGAVVYGNAGKPLYFCITSPPLPPLSPPPGLSRRLRTWAGLYTHKCHVITALESGAESNLCLDTRFSNHRKLLADISYQLTTSDCDNLCSRLGLSQASFDRIATRRPGDLAEHLYLMLLDWVEGHSGENCRQLLSIFSEFGISGISVTFHHNTDLDNLCDRVGTEVVRDDRTHSCDSAQGPSFLLGLSCKMVYCWRFVARFLGIGEGDIDSIDYDQSEPVGEKALKVLHKWMTLNGKEATYGVLLRVLYRVYQHDVHLCDAWNFTKNQLL